MGKKTTTSREHSDTRAIDRHVEINNVYVPFKRDNPKAKQETKGPKPLLASNQRQVKQR